MNKTFRPLFSSKYCHPRIVKFKVLYILISTFMLIGCTTSRPPETSPECKFNNNHPSDFCYKNSGTDISRPREKLIIFIHGILGGAATSWGKWPELVHADPKFKDYEFYFMNYNSPLFSHSPNIYETATQELERLKNLKAFEKYKDIHFVVHSMGGLIAKIMLLRLHSDSSTHLDRIKSVTFLGTPSQGSPLANLAHWFTSNPQAEDLQTAHINTYLQSLEDQWIQFLIFRDTRKLDFPRIYCAYEAKPTISGLWIVPRESAVSRCDAPQQSLNFDHLQISKATEIDVDPYLWAMTKIEESNNISMLDRDFRIHLIAGNEALIKDELQAAYQMFDTAADAVKKKKDQVGYAWVKLGLADLKRKWGQQKDALALYQEALSFFTVTKNFLGMAKTLRHLGDLESDIGNLEEARASYVRANTILDLMGNPPERAWVLLSLGLLDLRTNRKNSASENIKQANTIFEHFKDNRGIGYTKLAIGELALRNDQLNDSLKAYEEAFKEFEQNSNDDKYGKILAMLGIGNVKEIIGNSTEAETIYVNAFNLSAESQSGNAAGSLHLGKFLLAKQELQDGQRLLSKAQRSFIEDGDLRGETDAWLYLGKVKQLAGLYEEARKDIVQARENYKKINDLIGEAMSFLALGELSQSNFELEEARLNYNEAYKLCLITQNQRCEAQSLLKLAETNNVMEESDSARSMAEQAEIILGAVGDWRGIFKAHILLGSLDVQVGSDEQAISHYRKALKTAKERMDYQYQLKALVRLINVELGLPNFYEKATEHLVEAESLSDKTKDQNIKASIIMSRANHHLGRGEFEAAELKFKESANILEKFGSDRLQLAGIYNILGELSLGKYFGLLGYLGSQNQAPNFEKDAIGYLRSANQYFSKAVEICAPNKCSLETLDAYENLIHGSINESTDLSSEYAYRTAFFLKEKGNIKEASKYIHLGQCLGHINRKLSNDFEGVANAVNECWRASFE